MKRILSFVLAAVLVLCLASCSKTDTNSASSDEAKTSITVCLDWTPNTNHTGLYVALEKGYFADAGLDVKIVQPPENGAVQACAAGQAQFAVDAQDTLAPAFTSDTPLGVTAVAALIQHNTSGIMSKKGEGMDRPAGLTGKTYLTWDSPTEKAIMENVVNANGGDWTNCHRFYQDATDDDINSWTNTSKM